SYPSCHLNSVQMSRVLSFKSLCNKAKTNYGNGFDVENFDSKGDYAFYNKTAYEFISAQIQTYYK
ncbi:hypothetical protein KTI25_14465, partial [Acinetobacter ursingii]|nr:hypothetical protein [Acinetobacter ursingii]MCU4507742.1 hypothetical protein [Acinetobacter ursingii]